MVYSGKSTVAKCKTTDAPNEPESESGDLRHLRDWRSRRAEPEGHYSHRRAKTVARGGSHRFARGDWRPAILVVDPPRSHDVRFHGCGWCRRRRCRERTACRAAGVSGLLQGG